MRKKSVSESGFLSLRLFLGVTFCLIGALLGLFSWAGPTPYGGAKLGHATIRPGQTVEKHSFVQNLLLAFWQPAASSATPNAAPMIRRGVMRKSAAPGASRQPGSSASQVLTPVIGEAVSATVSPAVRDLPAASSFTLSTGQLAEGELSGRGPEQPANPLEYDPVIQSTTAPTVGMPPVGVSFEGLENNQACNGCIPPDPNGAVGPNHYVQMVNSSFAIYSKTGALLSGPKAINTLWSATPNATCATHNNGDPVVIYDQLADRWLLSQFTVQSGSENYAECIAISQTPDPTGAYWLYQFDESADTFHDYPHIGIWPDGYYMTTNLFPNSALLFSTGAGAWAFERPKMLLGQAARYVFFDETGLSTGCAPMATCTYVPGGQLPTSLNGKAPPPAGAPNYFIEVDNTNTPDTPPATSLHDEMHIWQFHVDWTNPTASTFGTSSTTPAAKPGFPGQYAGNAGQPNFIVPIADYLPVVCELATGASCVPQKQLQAQPPEYLDVLGDRLMHRVTYRNFGDHESLVVSHTAQGPADQSGGVARAGVRWYEVRGLSTTPTIYQQSTFAPLDPTNPLWRWMGSAAMDHSGDLAIAYSASGPNYFPSLHYAGRLVSDPLNELTQGEAVLFAGLGIEVAVPDYLQRNRWGDYSALQVDPTDDCTFWYTNEYCPVNGPLDGISIVEWHTRIGSFKFPTCVVTPPVLTTVVSRMTHAGAGDFDINLSLPPSTSPRAVECRSGGTSNDYHLVFTFANDLGSVAGASVTGHDPANGTGTVSGSPTVGPNVALGLTANQCAINLTNVSNAQYITVTLNGVVDVLGNSGDVVSPQLGILVGDVNATGGVDGNDVSAVQSHTRQTVGATTFQFDVNTTGAIDGNDVSATQSKTRTSLPSTP